MKPMSSSKPRQAIPGASSTLATTSMGKPVTMRGGAVRKTGPIMAVPKPINLPSRKAENNGFDPNVQLVPGGSWGAAGKPAPTVQQNPAPAPSQKVDSGDAPTILAPKAPWSTSHAVSAPTQSAVNSAVSSDFPKLGISSPLPPGASRVQHDAPLRPEASARSSNMQSEGQMRMQPEGQMRMQSEGHMRMQSEGQMRMQSEGQMRMQSDGQMRNNNMHTRRDDYGMGSRYSDDNDRDRGGRYSGAYQAPPMRWQQQGGYGNYGERNRMDGPGPSGGNSAHGQSVTSWSELDDEMDFKKPIVLASSTAAPPSKPVVTVSEDEKRQAVTNVARMAVRAQDPVEEAKMLAKKKQIELERMEQQLIEQQRRAEMEAIEREREEEERLKRDQEAQRRAAEESRVRAAEERAAADERNRRAEQDRFDERRREEERRYEDDSRRREDERSQYNQQPHFMKKSGEIARHRRQQEDELMETERKAASEQKLRELDSRRSHREHYGRFDRDSDAHDEYGRTHGEEGGGSEPSSPRNQWGGYSRHGDSNAPGDFEGRFHNQQLDPRDGRPRQPVGDSRGDVDGRLDQKGAYYAPSHRDRANDAASKGPRKLFDPKQNRFITEDEEPGFLRKEMAQREEAREQAERSRKESTVKPQEPRGKAEFRPRSEDPKIKDAADRAALKAEALLERRKRESDRREQIQAQQARDALENGMVAQADSHRYLGNRSKTAVPIPPQLPLPPYQNSAAARRAPAKTRDDEMARSDVGSDSQSQSGRFGAPPSESFQASQNVIAAQPPLKDLDLTFGGELLISNSTIGAGVGGLRFGNNLAGGKDPWAMDPSSEKLGDDPWNSWSGNAPPSGLKPAVWGVAGEDRAGLEDKLDGHREGARAAAEARPATSSGAREQQRVGRGGLHSMGRSGRVVEDRVGEREAESDPNKFASEVATGAADFILGGDDETGSDRDFQSHNLGRSAADSGIYDGGSRWDQSVGSGWARGDDESGQDQVFEGLGGGLAGGGQYQGFDAAVRWESGGGANWSRGEDEVANDRVLEGQGGGAGGRVGPVYDGAVRWEKAVESSSWSSWDALPQVSYASAFSSGDHGFGASKLAAPPLSLGFLQPLPQQPMWSTDGFSSSSLWGMQPTGGEGLPNPGGSAGGMSNSQGSMNHLGANAGSMAPGGDFSRVMQQQQQQQQQQQGAKNQQSKQAGGNKQHASKKGPNQKRPEAAFEGVQGQQRLDGLDRLPEAETYIGGIGDGRGGRGGTKAVAKPARGGHRSGPPRANTLGSQPAPNPGKQTSTRAPPGAAGGFFDGEFLRAEPEPSDSSGRSSRPGRGRAAAKFAAPQDGRQQGEWRDGLGMPQDRVL